MIDRYKKKGGFLQLVQLIETTAAEKREKFLQMIAAENPAWETEVRKKVLSLERIVQWPTEQLMECAPAFPTPIAAFAVVGLPEASQNQFWKALSASEQRKVKELLAERKPTAADVFSAQVRVMSEIRRLVAADKLKLERFAPDLVIPDDIENQLTITGLMQMSQGMGNKIKAG